MRNVLDTAFEFDYDVVDVGDNSTTVHGGLCLLRGIYINTTLSANDLPILDGATTVFTIPGGSFAGTWIPFGDVQFTTSLIVDPNDAATGSITVIYKKAA
jgi:hypothetical protein